jgi:hypothetical protein
VPANEQRPLRERLITPAVRFADTSLDIADLLLLGLLLGSWTEFERRVERGRALAALEHAPVPDEDIRAAATLFRYGHSLVSANDFTAWLRARSLRVSDLSGVIGRRLLREREEHRGSVGSPPDSSDVLWAEAVCGGELRALALAAADRLAAAHRLESGEHSSIDAARLPAALELAREPTATGLSKLGDPELRARLTRLLGLGDALARLREQVADGPAVARCMASHQLDWLQIDGDELVLDSEGAAREARLLHVDDGLSLAEIAERAGVAVNPRRLVLDRAPAEATATLIATAAGELAGPWSETDRWSVMLVDAKEPPSAQVPELRDRAVRELLRDSLDRTLAGRLVWEQAL